MYAYEIRNASGRICCSGDDTRHFCPACTAQLAARSRAAAAHEDDDDTADVLKTDAEWNAHLSAMLGVGSLVLGPPQDGYALATVRALRQAEATDDPDYQPYGQPADGYAIAITRQMRAEQ
jgi:hypothetical protein